MSVNTVDAIEKQPSFAFQPPTGGDVDLKSCDDTTFRVHSVLLGLASTVFADMFSGQVKSGTIALPEDAETISLLLAFTYPVAQPLITTLDLLDKCMLVARKYDVEKIAKVIEQTFHSKNSLVISDPLGVFRVSVKHHFPSIQTLAAKSLRPTHCDFLTVGGLTSFVNVFPDASHAIGLIGTQSARIKILCKVLFDQPLQLGIYPDQSYMACTSCWGYHKGYFGQSYVFVPGWYFIWAIRLHAALLQKPVDECNHYFTITYVMELEAFGKGACNSCIGQMKSNNISFNKWAQRAKQIIMEQLAELEPLYSL
ncbi:BTB domain-containing protein [Ceratobasidium theobromae]|uniref:BTB domain-containing protein n=1 Tax=Ceratobasidium theobromae TaxID=1582974 RepID=A0A5N5QU32_9AGAM|nr:BTB domain-containing protein [Ceratobasidium theobromae]